jgi:hypothetical protein
MRCAIFYVLTPVSAEGVVSRVGADAAVDYDLVFPYNNLMSDINACVRMEIVEAEDLGAALDMAQPRDGESVMNTHEVAEGR